MRALSAPVDRSALDAVVLADGPHAAALVLGLTLAERGRRVAARLGARRVLVVDGAAARTQVKAWWQEGGARGLLVLRARDQLVHMPLAAPLLAAAGERRVAVGADGAPAGALLGTDGAAAELVAAIAGAAEGAGAGAGGPIDDDAIAARWLAAGAAAVPHGEVARHPATTPAERRAAGRFLEQIVHKEQDGPVTRYAFRTVSVPITRLLLRTPLTPNHVSMMVALLGIVGVYFTASRSYDSVILGAGIMLAANYLDGCDGEIARLKLQTSRLGAWMDTVTDELSQLFFMIALGYHNYLVFGRDPLWGWSIVLGAASYLISIAGIYYFLITVLGTANSQDYTGKTDLITEPDGTARVVPRPPKAPRKVERPRWMQVAIETAPHLIRRDFVNLGAFVFALLHINHISYPIMVIGGVGTAVVIIPNHIALLRKKRRAARLNATRLAA